MTVSEIYDLYYPLTSKAREILERHSRSVASLALKLNAGREDERLVGEAAMLHDIGIFLTDADGIYCFGSEPYIRHGVLGADLLRQHGFDERICRVAERHTGAGIFPNDIAQLNLPLPSDRILYPETHLERLICYADKFFSKSGDMQMKSLERVRASMARHSETTLQRFEELHKEFNY